MKEEDDTGKAGMNAAVERLLEARLQAAPLPDLPAGIRPQNLTRAYDFQELLNARLAKEYGAPIGYKIGCTTGVMQDYMGIPHPCAGRIFATTVVQHHGSYPRNRLCRPGVECEIAIRIGRPMNDRHLYTAADCMAYVAEVMAGIELVDDRWNDFRKVSTPVLVSDNFFNAGGVYASGTTLPFEEIGSLTGKMWINDEVAGSGGAADNAQHPLAALAWLANHCQARARPLAKDDLVLLGSVVQTQWIGAGDRVRIEFAGLPPCSLQLV